MAPEKAHIHTFGIAVRLKSCKPLELYQASILLVRYVSTQKL